MILKHLMTDQYYTFTFELSTKIIIKIPEGYSCMSAAMMLAEGLEMKIRSGELGSRFGKKFEINVPFRGPKGLEQLVCKCER